MGGIGSKKREQPETQPAGDAAAGDAAGAAAAGAETQPQIFEKIKNAAAIVSAKYTEEISIPIGNQVTKNTRGFIIFVIVGIVILAVVLIILFSMVAYKYNNPPPIEESGTLKDDQGKLLVVNPGTTPTLSLVPIGGATPLAVWSFKNGTISATTDGTTKYYLSTSESGDVIVLNAPTDASVWTYNGIEFLNVKTSGYLCSTQTAVVLKPQPENTLKFDTPGYKLHYYPSWIGWSTSLGIILSLVLLVILVPVLWAAAKRIRRVNKSIAGLIYAVKNDQTDQAKQLVENDFLKYLPTVKTVPFQQ